ncbi:MAG: RNA 2',3'-cyclic phosphodiesterase [Nitrososphaerales archaeon]
MRTFLSYDIDDDMIRTRVAALQQEIGSTGADLKLVNPSILHFTIRFLGEIDEAKRDRIILAIEGRVKPLETEVTFRGVGVFPSESKILVVWIGIDENTAKVLSERSREVNSLLQQVGPLREDSHEEFNPHVTIARVRTGRNKEALLDFIKEHKNEEFGKSMIGLLRLKLSDLLPSGPKYSDIHVFK